MLSYAFWQLLATQPIELRAAITGFMETYSYLIKYGCDFQLATRDEHELALLPKDDGSDKVNGLDKISFERFANFIAGFHNLPDDSVSPRYHYGELRLSRLNVCAWFLLRKLTFFHAEPQWGSYLARFLAPLLSIFAVLSVALNAMQVELAVQSSPQDLAPRWLTFAHVSRGFSCAILVITAIVILFFGLLIGFMTVHDLWFARSVLRQRKRQMTQGQIEFKSGVI